MKDTKEQSIRKKEGIKAQKIRKVTKLREKGITLIALVVTIIILLILTGVTLNMALSDNGLFKKAREAVEKYEKAQEDEEEAIRQISTQMYSEYVGATVTGYEPSEKECTITSITSGVSAQDKAASGTVIGNDGNQTFKTDKDMQWRVWDFDGNILRIVGDPTGQALALKGVAGYNNGVWAIEEICKECYSNEKNGVTVTSLKRSDIQKVSNYDYTQYTYKKDGEKDVADNSKLDEELIYFGESKTYNTNNQYPKMWNDIDSEWTYEYDKKTKTAKGVDKECKTWEDVGKGKGQIQEEEMTKGSSGIIFKQSHYAHEYIKEEFDNEKYFDLIFKNSKNEPTHLYWLAGRCTGLFEDYCEFRGTRVNCDESGLSNISSNCFCSSKIGESPRQGIGNCYIRPLVSIDLNKSKCTLTAEFR